MTRPTGILHRFLCTLIAVLALASPAFAHAEFQGSSPAADALLDALPETVSLRFSEPVGVLTMEWLLPDGTRSAAEASAKPDALSISAPPETGRGTYVLNWRVASADGHPVGGALVFSVGEVTGGAEPDVPATAIPSIAARYLAVLSMVLTVGAALYAAMIAPLPPVAGRLWRTSALAALPLAGVALGAYGLDLLGRGFPALLSPAPWIAAVSAPRGWGLLIGAVAALIAGSSLGKCGVALFALALGAISLAVSGHASVGPSRWIGQPLMGLHAAALIFWIGGLPPLIASLSGANNLRALHRFSKVALPAVIVLVASGVGLIFIHSVDVATLIGSNWGKLLAFKLVLVACMLALALLNKTCLTPALAAAPLAAQSGLRRSIGAEIALGMIVLLVAMCFRLTPPPGPEEATDQIYLHLHGAEVMADVTFSDAPPGAINITIYFADGGGDPLLPKEASLLFTDTLEGIGPIKVEAELTPEGTWLAGPLTLPTEGPWEMKLSVLITDFEQSTLTATLATQE
ncbi:copper resistance CopC/CopD family protein [Pararhodobacter oceanensis]|uniref:Copper resistance protein CopC n=1 Tax=Pararhodobacter oceanensis TaxID=2172121 RepID=A0A2T8HQK8_9RHOB|nr:copper resistance protein CopC [Pararhodobacter oceanensis]PVH27710.1 copper resistance protein CopC [Pararhodobacter oceanensis]